MKNKTEKLPIREYPISGWPIHSEAKSYSLIECRKHSDPTFFREITTFYDKTGQPIRKCFLDSRFNNKIRSYKYSESLTQDKLPVKVKEIRTEKYINQGKYKLNDRNELKLSAASGNWEKVSEELQSVLKTNDKNKKLSIFKTIFNKTNTELTTSITEYTTEANKKHSKHKPKSITASITRTYNEFILNDINKDKDIILPRADDFLVYRFLPNEEKCVGLTEYFLKQHGLENLGINIKIPSSKVRKKALAHFLSFDREIGWRTVPSKISIVEVAAHESEHAYQHAQIGRLGIGASEYEKDCKFILGEISHSHDKKEAQKYYEACMNYPSIEDINYAQKHDENYLEIRANIAAKKAKNEYKKGQKILKNIFKYFPDNDNMF